jgi:hypothetical protein
MSGIGFFTKQLPSTSCALTGSQRKTKTGNRRQGTHYAGQAPDKNHFAKRSP